jgi:hypothetical protein
MAWSSRHDWGAGVGIGNSAHGWRIRAADTTWEKAKKQKSLTWYVRLVFVSLLRDEKSEYPSDASVLGRCGSREAGACSCEVGNGGMTMGMVGRRECFILKRAETDGQVTRCGKRLETEGMKRSYPTTKIFGNVEERDE